MSTRRDDAEAAAEWVGRLSGALTPTALSRRRANLLDSRQADQVGASFGGRASRLAALKARYDPPLLFGVPLP